MRLYCWEMSMFSSFNLPRTSLFVCIFLQFEFDEYTFSTNSLEFCIRGGSSTSPSSNAVWDKTKTAPIFFCCSKRNAKVATNMTFMIGSAFETLKETNACWSRTLHLREMCSSLTAISEFSQLRCNPRGSWHFGGPHGQISRWRSAITHRYVTRPTIYIDDIAILVDSSLAPQRLQADGNTTELSVRFLDMPSAIFSSLSSGVLLMIAA